MSFDSLLAILGLIVAVYALLPRHRLLDLKLRVGRFDWGIVIGTFFLVHYLLLYDVFQSLGLTVPTGVSHWGITPANASYICVLGATAILVTRIRYRGIPRSRLPHLKRLVLELLWNDRHGDMAALLRRRWPDITRHLAKDENAQEIIRIVLSHHGFVREIADKDPYFATDILPMTTYEVIEFAGVFFRRLMSNTSSALFHELRQNRDLAGGPRYRIPDENRLLLRLLRNASEAQRLSVYVPVGEAMIEELRRLRADPSQDSNLRPVYGFADNRDEDNKWSSKLFVGMAFFDIMVREAAFQGIRWHMWLYYLPVIVKEIVRNYSEERPDVDHEAEWPTVYSYILYEMFDCQCEWVKLARELPDGNHHKRFRHANLHHENDNIPKSAILSLMQCVRTVVECEKLSEKFRAYLLEMAVDLYLEFSQGHEYAQVAECLRASLTAGGLFGGRPGAVHERLLAQIMDYRRIGHPENDSALNLLATELAQNVEGPE